MSETVRNDSLDNFETNRDQDLGKAIAQAASALSNNARKPTGMNGVAVDKNLRSEKTNGITEEKR